MKHQQPHFAHVQEHLERVRDGYSYIPYPESIYLGQQEDDHFWELIGLRLQGCPVVVLAALRFERIERKGVVDSRASLGAYLTANPNPDRPEGGRLIALLPHKDEPIPKFLSGLRAGKGLTPVSIDRARVEIAFDFRADNPAALRDLVEAAPELKSHYYRTVEGHVFRGESHDVEPVNGPAHRYIAVKAPQQLLPQGVIHMPTLIVAHRFIGLQVAVADEAARLAVRNWVPFVSATASAISLVSMGQ